MCYRLYARYDGLNVIWFKFDMAENVYGLNHGVQQIEFLLVNYFGNFS